MSEIAPTLLAIQEAIQAHSNALAGGDESAVGLVMGAVVSWEETRYDQETGLQAYVTLYSSTSGSPAHSLGLALSLLEQVTHDVVGCKG